MFFLVRVSGSIKAAYDSFVSHCKDMPASSIIPLYYEKFVAYISPSDELYRLDEIPSDRLVSDRLWILEEGHCLRSQVFSF